MQVFQTLSGLSPYLVLGTWYLVPGTRYLQAMRRYIPGACLLVADRPQTPVKPGASAPGFLSRLRRLLLPAGREKSSTRLLLAVTIFLFSRHA